jgi:Ca2+-binding EF-hand superfamily protein
MKNKTLALTIAATILGASSFALAQGPGKPCGGHGRGAHFFDELDANKDGVVTQAEMLQKRLEHFDKMDANRDGKLTKEERAAMHDKFAKERFAQKDTNKDGKLSGDELKHFPQKLLERIDTNKDGAITLAELEANKPKMREGRDGKGRGPWGSDETITKDQVKAKVTEHFTRMDANKDGKLTKDELKGPRHHGKRHGWGHKRGERGEGA